MLKMLRLKFGSSQNQPPLSFDPGQMTVFVGPNNAGKSLILREINQSLVETQRNVSGLIVHSIEFQSLAVEKVKQLFPPARQDGFAELREPLRGRHSAVNLHQYIIELERLYKANIPNTARTHLAALYQIFTILLDGKTRLDLTHDTPSGDLKSLPTNLLQALFHDEEARNHLRNLTYEAFGYYATIDPTRMVKLRLCMSKVEPKGEEKALNAEAVEFFKNAKSILEFSDGVKAFTGIVAAVLCAHYLIMLIDEPEAFLHPPLIRKLGKVLTELAATREGNVLAATHSSDFLMGCIQSKKKVNVVRLTYKDGVPSARLLPADKLEEIMRDPFMRSTSVLTALFHEGTVVCEADMDRAFYQEINERLLEAKDSGITDSLFLNANGKDSLGRIAKPLREMGIPTGIVVDLDIIEKGNFVDLLRSAFVPETLIVSWRVIKDKVNSRFGELKLKAKETGLSALDLQHKELAENLIASLAEYGVFVVDTGETERWLPELQIDKRIHGPNWLIEAFENMGSDPNSPNYILPTEGDVWNFIRKIAVWITNPNRKGMPE